LPKEADRRHSQDIFTSPVPTSVQQQPSARLRFVIGLLSDFSTVSVEGCCCTDVGTGLVKMSCECLLSASFGNEASFIAVSV
jgi:hypothetical protein